jgi:hypothetical protein
MRTLTPSHGREPQNSQLKASQILVVHDDQDSLALSRESLEITGRIVPPPTTLGMRSNNNARGWGAADDSIRESPPAALTGLPA